MAMNPSLHPPGMQPMQPMMMMNQPGLQPPQMQPMMGSQVPMNTLVPMSVPMQPAQQPPYPMPDPYGGGKALPDSSVAVRNALDGVVY